MDDREGWRRHRSGWLERLLLWLAVPLLRLHGRTLRIRAEGAEQVHTLLASGRPVILASWHGRVLLLPFHLQGLLETMMISTSRDGERIAQVCERLGYETVRGSSSAGGARALLQFVRRLRGGGVGGHVVDGPRGPAGEVKPGLILLAQRSGAAIVPIYASAARRWEARSWDSMQIAWPWSRVLVRYDAPIEAEKHLDADGSERLRGEVETRMREGYARLERDLGLLA